MKTHTLPSSHRSRVLSALINSRFLLLFFIGLSTGLTAAVTPMPVISHGVPVFASGTAPAVQTSAANDTNEASMWVSSAVPTWLAYDLSSVPTSQRQQVLVAWYAPWALGYINAAPISDAFQIPIDYTIETNPAAGGGSAPTAGWTTLVSVTDNNRNTRQHLLNLVGANWIRLRSTRSSNPASIAIEMDVHSAPEGASDSWLFMGDSITGWAAHLFSDLPKRVNSLATSRWPAVVGAAIGGSNTGSALNVIDDTLAGYPGRFVALCYGTNDGNTSGFSDNLEALILKVIAAGKVPVIPHMPWSDIPDQLNKAPGINARIDALCTKYPAVRRGPDLYAAFSGRTDLIPSGDVHPNDAGNKEMRRLWALSMTSDSSPISVSIMPNSSTLAPQGSIQLTATVMGTINTAVTWSVQEGSGAGTVTSSGLYTAPTTPATYHVVATSKADPTQIAIATIVVSASVPPPPPPTSVTVKVSPFTKVTTLGGSVQYTATVTGSANTAVTWSIVEGSAGGTIDANGKYTAPVVAGKYHIVATSKADPTKSATASIDVSASTQWVTVNLTPASKKITADDTLQFTAIVSATLNTAVTWSIQEGIAGGSISPGGLYTPAGEGVFHIVATSIANPAKSDASTVTVTPSIKNIAVSISPVAATSPPSAYTQFSATVTGNTNTAVTWTVREGSAGGTVSTTGKYKAPATAGIYHVVATSKANPAKSAAATITVGTVSTPAPVIASFIATPASITTGGSATLSWSSTGATSLSISPSVGSVTGTSVLVSPTVTTTYTLTATNATSSVTKTTKVTVTPPVQIVPAITSFTATPSLITAGGASTLSWSVTGATSLSISPAIGTVTGTSVTVSPAATTAYTLTASNATGSASLSTTVTVSASSTPLGKAPVVRLKRDDHVATLEMDYNADNPWGQWWTMTGSGKDDAGFLVTWWPDGSSPTSMGSMGGCMGCIGACGNPTDPTALSKWMVTANRRVQIQPLVNDGLYHVCVERINSLGEVTSLPTEITFSGGDGTRVDALRASLTQFDDFNLPMGAADEMRWNNAASTSTDPRFNLFFINDQFHAHSLNGTRRDNTGDRSQAAQRFRKPIAIENGVRRRLVFDMDSPLSPRSVWYLDLSPQADDLTGHTDFFDEDGVKGLPAGVLRLRSQFQTFSVNLIGADGASHQIASVDMQAAGEEALTNVRRAFDIRVGTDGIQVFIDGKSVINVAFPANTFKPGTYHLLWNAFGYNTPKDNVPYYLLHWDNFGFDGPNLETREIHNYVTRIAGTDYQKSERWSSTYPSFTVKIPDDLRPKIASATAEAWLVFTYQMGDYSQFNLLPGDYVQVNGGTKFTLPARLNNSSPLDPSLASWDKPYTVRVKLGSLVSGGTSPLLVGDNSFKFFADNTGLLNVHVEVFYPTGSAPAYTAPASIHPFPMHADLPKLGPPTRVQSIGSTMIDRNMYNADDPAVLTISVSGVTPVSILAGNDTYAEWAPELMLHPVHSQEVWSTGGTPGIATVELFLRKKGTGTGPGDSIAVLNTLRDAPAPQVRYTFAIDTKKYANGDYELFVQATNSQGVKGHPSYAVTAQRWDASELSGAYYPINIKIQN